MTSRFGDKWFLPLYWRFSSKSIQNESELLPRFIDSFGFSLWCRSIKVKKLFLGDQLMCLYNTFMISPLESTLAFLLRRWGFLTSPQMTLTPAKTAAFEAVFTGFSGGPAAYTLPYPKHEFTRWLTAEKGLLLHGSNRRGLRQLEPRHQTNYRGKPVEAVFASSDGIWPFFFATLNYQNPGLSVARNASLFLCGEKYYYFSVSQAALGADLWTEGSVYLLSPDGFASQDPGGIWRQEWASSSPVVPLAELPVTAEDFPFHRQVVGFTPGERMLTTWRRYGKRRAF
jgi:hypothetical protein